MVGLGALNKAEFLNAGGSVFVKEMPHLKTRVVHGNTLTTAVILRTLPEKLSEVRCKAFAWRSASVSHACGSLLRCEAGDTVRERESEGRHSRNGLTWCGRVCVRAKLWWKHQR